MSGFENHTSLSQPGKLPSIAMLPSLDPNSAHPTTNSGNSNSVSGNGINVSSTTNVSFYAHHYQPAAAILSTSASSSCFLQPAPMAATGLGMLSQPLDNQTPPLTPTVTPPSYLMDLMEMKRKCSVDVGPFGFSSTVQNQQPQQQSMDDVYRRASTSHATDDRNWTYRYPMAADYHHHQHQMYGSTGSASASYHQASFTYPESSNKSGSASTGCNGSNSNNTSRRGSVRAPPIQQNSKDHKHICKYALCGWSFKRYEHLKRHMLVHSGERPYMCQFPGCGKSFSRSDNFRAHCRTHAKKTYSVSKNQPQLQQSKHQPQEASSYSNNNQSHVLMQQQQHQQQQPQHADPMFPSGPFMSQHDPYMAHGFPPTALSYSPYYHSHHYSFQQQQQAQYPTVTSPTVPMTSSTAGPANPDAASTATMMPPPQPATISMMERRGSSPVGSPSSIEDDKIHACIIAECKRPFKRLEHLKRHMRTHTLERPFACSHPNCHKTFSRSDNLSQHIKTHRRHSALRRGSSGSGGGSGVDDPMSDVEDDETLWS